MNFIVIIIDKGSFIESKTKSVCFLKFYQFIMQMIHYVLPFLLWIRLLKGKEDKERYWQKLGYYPKNKPWKDDCFLVHIHGASVGETVSALPVVRRLLDYHSNIEVVVTSGTKTSGDIMRKRLPKRSHHFYACYDTPQSVKKFFDYFNPNMSFIIDSEIWPLHILEAQKRQIPLFALNMRLSEKSQKFWLKHKEAFALILKSYHGFFVQNDMTAAFIRKFASSQKIRICPNLKWAFSETSPSLHQYDSIKNHLNERMIITFLSTHENEEKLLVKSLKALQKEKDFLIVIVPRHPERYKEILKDISSFFTKNEIGIRTNGDDPELHHKIYLADTIGEVPLWGKLSNLVIMGKSFIPPGGGHNPIEVSFMKSPLIVGAYMHNFSEITEEFLYHNSIIQVNSVQDLKDICRKVIDNPDYAQRLARSAYQLCVANKKNVFDFFYDIEAYLPKKYTS